MAAWDVSILNQARGLTELATVAAQAGRQMSCLAKIPISLH